MKWILLVIVLGCSGCALDGLVVRYVPTPGQDVGRLEVGFQFKEQNREPSEIRSPFERRNWR